MAFVAMLLILYAPIKLGVLSLSNLEAKKDLVDALSTIFGCAILLLGAVLSYIRFFKGRMLKPKINLQLQTGLLSQGENNLHWIEIAIENKGNVAVWNYTLKLLATPHPGDGSSTDVSDRISIPKVDDGEHLVDVGETAFEHAIIELSKCPYAYTFEAVLKDNRGTQWRRCITVPNNEPVGDTQASHRSFS